MDTRNVKTRLAGAVVGAIAALVVGGAGLAWAQEDTTTTRPPAAETPDGSADGARGAHGDHWCDKDEAPEGDSTSL